jgi:hypothetical protein
MVPEFEGGHDASVDQRIGHIHEVTNAARVGGDGVARQGGRPCQEARACPGSGSVSYVGLPAETRDGPRERRAACQTMMS